MISTARSTTPYHVTTSTRCVYSGSVMGQVPLHSIFACILVSKFISVYFSVFLTVQSIIVVIGLWLFFSSNFSTPVCPERVIVLLPEYRYRKYSLIRRFLIPTMCRTFVTTSCLRRRMMSCTDSLSIRKVRFEKFLLGLVANEISLDLDNPTRLCHTSTLYPRLCRFISTFICMFAHLFSTSSGQGVKGRKGTPFPHTPIFGSKRSPTSNCYNARKRPQTGAQT